MEQVLISYHTKGRYLVSSNCHKGGKNNTSQLERSESYLSSLATNNTANQRSYLDPNINLLLSILASFTAAQKDIYHRYYPLLLSSSSRSRDELPHPPSTFSFSVIPLTCLYFKIGTNNHKPLGLQVKDKCQFCQLSRKKQVLYIN